MHDAGNSFRTLTPLLLSTTYLFQSAHAQPDAAKAFPVRPIRIIVVSLTGGGSDVAARVIGQKLTGAWPASYRRQPAWGDRRDCC